MARASLGVAFLLLGVALGVSPETETELQDLPTTCRIRVKGPGGKGEGPAVESASFRCTGKDLPVRLQVHPAVLEGLEEAEGVKLEALESEKGFVLFSGVTGVLLEDCLFADLVGTTLAPLVFVNSRVGISGCEFSRNSGARSGGLHATESVSVVSKTSFTDNAGLSFGAVGAFEDSRIALRDCSFLGNTGGTEVDPLGGFVAGAVFAFKNTLLEIRSGVFNGNVAVGGGGGAITMVNKCITTVLDTEFEGNSGDSGAIAALQFSKLTIKDSVFTRNKGAELAGTISLRITSQVEVRGSVFSFNVAGTGGVLAMGGSDITMLDDVLEHNEGVTWGGVVTVVEGGQLTVSGSVFGENLGVAGGAIFGDSSESVIIEFSEFKGNFGGKHGGAIRQSNCRNTKIVSCTFSANSAMLNGGAVAQMGCAESSSSALGLVGCEEGGEQRCGTVAIIDSAFEDNSAAQQGRDVCQASCETLILKSSDFSASKEILGVNSVYQEHCGLRTEEGNTFTLGSVFVNESGLEARDCPLEEE